MINSIHDTVIRGNGCHIGHFTVVEEGVVLGNNVHIGNNVTIYPGTIVSDNVFISDNCVLGKQPLVSISSTVKIDSPLPPLKLGEGSIIGTSAVIYAGTSIGQNSLVGDLATIREKCKVGNYVVIGRGVAVENNVNIGDYTKIQTSAYITAHMEIEERVFIAPMVTTTNDNFIGRTEQRFKHIKGAHIKKGSRVGGGSILLPGITVAEETFVAAGALVTRDTEPGTAVKGLPARKFRQVPEEELLENQ